jgi:hypothetical protein
MLSAFSRVDISDSLIVADAPARASLSFIIVAVVIVYRSKPGLSQRSLLKHLLDLCGFYTISVPIREYIVNFKDLHGCLVSAVKCKINANSSIRIKLC